MQVKDMMFDGHPHVLKAQQFSRSFAEKVFIPLSDRIQKMLAVRSCSHLLDGKGMISLFTAESTRTRGSEEIAFELLGGKVILSVPGAKFSSAMGKAESLVDTVRVLSDYCADVIVVRNDSDTEMPIAEIAERIQTPIINAGDGADKDKQHPTQALLDLYTIHTYLGAIDGISVAMIGDLKNGRTVRSLCYLLAKWKIGKLYLVSPPGLEIGTDIKEYLAKHNVDFAECNDIRDVAGKVDVFYQTRTQTNLGSAAVDRNDPKNGFTIINGEVVRMAKEDAIIMHPLPCLGEIVRAEVDGDHRAVYIDGHKGKPSQLKCGLITRMAGHLLVVSPEVACSLL